MKDISDLKHTSVRLIRGELSGGEIIVLDNGAVINAEDEAMLQALHSRSTGGLRNHLEILAAKGAGNFMSSFYVGYGHKSIGDCGSTTIFIEGVSMLAAKAVQDNPLYSGQEASTRYIDFSEQPFIDPTRTSEGKNILEAQRQFYLDAQNPTREHLRKMHYKNEGEKDSVYEKAINARAFDIARSLLPAGASTNLAWHTDLRHAADKMLFLRHHPLAEIREIGTGLEEALAKHHPNSFGHKKYPETENYQDLIAENYFYHNSKSPEAPIVDFSGIDFEEMKKYGKLLNERPPKTELPKFLGQIGTIAVEFQLDFGSFRDIQRHRAINQRMPLLTSELGFNRWYVENFPESVRNKLPEHLEAINKKIAGLNISKEEEQYFIPMGYNVPNRFIGDLPAAIYMIELRAKSDVHPTLQNAAYDMARQINEKLKIPVYVGTEPGRFDIKRGEHDIVLREK